MEDYEEEVFNEYSGDIEIAGDEYPDEPLQANVQPDNEEEHSEDESEAGSSKRVRYVANFKVIPVW